MTALEIQCSFCDATATGCSPSAGVRSCARHTQAAQRLAVDIIDAQPILAAALNDARVSFALQVYAREGQATEEPWKRALAAAQDIGAETLIACTSGRTVHTELEAIDEGYRLANAAKYSALAPHVRAKVDPLIAALIAALRDVSARRGGLR